MERRGNSARAARKGRKAKKKGRHAPSSLLPSSSLPPSSALHFPSLLAPSTIVVVGERSKVGGSE